jgi:hypothetical protein
MNKLLKTVAVLQILEAVSFIDLSATATKKSYDKHRNLRPEYHIVTGGMQGNLMLFSVSFDVSQGFVSSALWLLLIYDYELTDKYQRLLLSTHEHVYYLRYAA